MFLWYEVRQPDGVGPNHRGLWPWSKHRNPRALEPFAGFAGIWFRQTILVSRRLVCVGWKRNWRSDPQNMCWSPLILKIAALQRKFAGYAFGTQSWVWSWESWGLHISDEPGQYLYRVWGLLGDCWISRHQAQREKEEMRDTDRQVISSSESSQLIVEAICSSTLSCPETNTFAWHEMKGSLTCLANYIAEVSPDSAVVD